MSNEKNILFEVKNVKKFKPIPPRFYMTIKGYKLVQLILTISLALILLIFGSMSNYIFTTNKINTANSEINILKVKLEEESVMINELNRKIESLDTQLKVCIEENE